MVALDGEPAFAMERVSDVTFSIVGQPAGIFVRFDSSTEPTHAEVVLRGVPEDLYAAQLGFQHGPAIPEQRFPLPLQSGAMRRSLMCSGSSAPPPAAHRPQVFAEQIDHPGHGGHQPEALWKTHRTESAKIVLGDRASATVVEALS